MWPISSCQVLVGVHTVRVPKDSDGLRRSTSSKTLSLAKRSWLGGDIPVYVRLCSNYMIRPISCPNLNEEAMQITSPIKTLDSFFYWSEIFLSGKRRGISRNSTFTRITSHPLRSLDIHIFTAHGSFKNIPFFLNEYRRGRLIDPESLNMSDWPHQVFLCPDS